jgi:hypothetical protein
MFSILDPDRNGLRYSTPLTKYGISCVLAFLWSAVFSIITAEMVYFGYSVVGHWLAISMLFVTYYVFSQERKHSHPSPPNKVQWDLEKEG